MAKSNLTHTQKAIAITTIIILLVVSITNVVLSSITWSTFAVNEQANNDLLANWAQGPILDIQVAATCPSGYTPAYSKEWPGTNPACWCGDVTSANKQTFGVTCDNFCSGTCSSSQLQAGCVEAPGQPAQSLSNWAVIGTTPVQICLKRSTTENWGVNGLFSGGTCPDGYTSCGTDPDTKYCTKESVCPIIGVAAVANNATLNTVCGNFGELLDCTVLEDNDATGNTKVLAWFRVDNPPPTGINLPISQFRVNEFGMCLSSNQDNVTPNRTQYFQLAEQPASCGTEGDILWAAGDGNAESFLFAVNGLSPYISSLDQFPNPGMSGYYETGRTGNDYIYYLFEQPYVPWKAEYRDDMKTFMDNTDIISRITNALRGFLIISAIGFFFLAIVFTILQGLYLCGVHFGETVKKVGRGFIYLFLFVQLPIQLWGLVLTAKTSSYFSKVSKNQVSVEYVNEQFSHVPGQLAMALGSTIAAFVVTTIAIILLIVMDLYGRKAKKRTRANRHRLDSEAQAITVAAANGANGQPDIKASPQSEGISNDATRQVQQ